MGRLNRAIRIQETLLDEPYEKLLSLLEKREISSYLNLSETTTQELQMKIQECEGQIAQAKESNVRIERILEIANSRVYP